MGSIIRKLILFKAGARLTDEARYVREALSAVGLPLDRLSEVHLEVQLLL